MLGLGHDQLFSLLQLIKGHHQWMIQILLVISFAYVLFYLLKKSYKRLQPITKKSSKIWDDALLEAAYNPLKSLILILALILIIEIIHFEIIKIPFFDRLKMIMPAFVVIAFTFFFLRFGKHFELSYVEKKSAKAFVDRTTVRAIFNMYQVIVIGLSLITLLQIFGIPLSGVIAFGGLGGIAIGFAAKDMLANFFGGIMIFLDRPFVIGDWIRSPDREIEGTVEHIGWRQVRIRNLEQRPIYIPNSLFSTIVIENPSRMSHRRIRHTFTIRYQDVGKVDEVVKVIENNLRNYPDVDSSKNILVALISPGSYSLDILVEVYTKAVNKVPFYQVQHAIIVQILSIFESLGVQSPYPTQTVYLENSHAVLNHVEKKLQ